MVPIPWQQWQTKWGWNCLCTTWCLTKGPGICSYYPTYIRMCQSGWLGEMVRYQGQDCSLDQGIHTDGCAGHKWRKVISLLSTGQIYVVIILLMSLAYVELHYSTTVDQCRERAIYYWAHRSQLAQGYLCRVEMVVITRKVIHSNRMALVALQAWAKVVRCLDSTAMFFSVARRGSRGNMPHPCSIMHAQIYELAHWCAGRWSSAASRGKDS